MDKASIELIESISNTKTVKSFLDMYCGAGGSSEGVKQAAKELGISFKSIAINHSKLAILSHTNNHPETKHYCAGMEQLRPQLVVPGGRLHLLWASPSCTHHSLARGSKPMNDQLRAGARYVIDYAEGAYIDNIIVENVKEFRNWGPIYTNPDHPKYGRPIPGREGEFFNSWIEDLRRLDYRIDHRLLNAADYGEHTSRERFFLIARKKHLCKTITWPAPTHRKMQVEDSQVLLFPDNRKPWLPVRDVIDWTLPMTSIFTKKKNGAPRLKTSTMNRILAGLEKMGQDAEPFIVVLRNHMNGRSMDEPLPTLAANGEHFALCAPVLIELNHGKSDMRSYSVDNPLRTQTSADTMGLVSTMLVPVNHGAGDNRSYSLDAPIPTLTSVDAMGLVKAFMVRYNGTGKTESIDQPIPTLTANDRFGLVVISGTTYKIDILFRMLHPKEMAAAMGFPEGYKFAGSRRDVVKSIGNAVSVRTAKALALEVLSPKNKVSGPERSISAVA